MSKNLVIVESPAKVKTLKKYLGKDYDVLPSYGHVRDLVPKEGAVDPDNKFTMKYQIIEKNAKYVEAICTGLKHASALYLATDPDREGEAIAWHLYELIKQRKGLTNKPVHRIVFNEITKSAVQNAIDHARELSINLVNAQQARRALDYLVGFKLSPLLWKKIRRGLSAGRVQSPALRLIVEREEEIEQFKTQEYWSIEADLAINDDNSFIAKLTEYNGEKLKQFSIIDATQATTIKEDLLKKANGHLFVEKITKNKRKRNPAAPFTTSTLQQEGVRKLGFTSQKVMRTAQQLYEGIDIGDGAVGLITYMRTDSVNLANEAIQDIRSFIGEKYGEHNVPENPRLYKTKAKNAQEAHEAIRPTSIRIEPDHIKNKLSIEQYKLYNLIWKRAVASQMLHATINQVAIDFSCKTGNNFRSNGSIIEDPGFIQVYQESLDDQQEEKKDFIFPPMKEGDKINLQQIRSEQHFTEPPPRYSEASLVKTLEEYGIGRPSTYATIISTLLHREYVTLETKRFIPTDVGRIVNKFLTAYFTQYVDYEFTAKLEDHLDEIARGEKEWLPVLENFWKPFNALLLDTEKNVQRKDVTQEQLEEKCPKCQKHQLSIRLGKRGRFIGCTGYPDCDYTRSLVTDEQHSVDQNVIEGRNCPQCSSGLVLKEGKYGKFVGCSGYPKCKFI
jgi:DNA topoisomerase-1